MNFKVGDIVICHGWDPVEGKRGFIEEIIRDSFENRTGRFWLARYSVYGFTKSEFPSGGSFYYGDFVEDNLESTKEVMTVEKLENFKDMEPDNKGIRKDMDIVIKNLGRESGRNE